MPSGLSGTSQPLPPGARSERRQNVASARGRTGLAVQAPGPEVALCGAPRSVPNRGPAGWLAGGGRLGARDMTDGDEDWGRGWPAGCRGGAGGSGSDPHLGRPPSGQLGPAGGGDERGSGCWPLGGGRPPCFPAHPETRAQESPTRLLQVSGAGGTGVPLPGLTVPRPDRELCLQPREGLPPGASTF